MATQQEVQLFDALLDKGLDQDKAKATVLRARERNIIQESLSGLGIQVEEKVEVVEEVKEEVEDLPGLDIGVIAGRAITEAAGEFKFESGVDDGVIKSGLKFLGNLPANAAQLGGDIITIVSDPVGTATSVKELAGTAVEQGLNKAFSTEIGQDLLRKAGAPEENLRKIREEGFFTTEERAILKDAIGDELTRIADEPGRVKELLVENPADVLLTVTGGLGVAKNVAKSKNLTSLANKIEQVQKITNPINVLATELKVATGVAKAPGKITAAIIRTVTPKGISKAIAGIDEITATTLKKTSKAELDDVIRTAEASVTDIENPTAFAKAGEKATSALDELKVQKNLAGKSKGDALKGVADKTIDTKPVVDKFDDLLADRFNLQVAEDGKLVALPGKIPKSADELKSFSDALQELRTAPQGKITLENLDALVDNLQAALNRAKLERPGAKLTTAEKTVNSFIEGNINKALKDAAGSKFVKANEDFRNAAELVSDLEKSVGPSGTRAAGLFKSLFSPQAGERTRQIFKRTKELTGIDLAKESVLAKFAMEAVGDTRGLSLLEAAVGAQAGIINPNIIQKALQTIFKPKKIARKLTKKQSLLERLGKSK